MKWTTKKAILEVLELQRNTEAWFVCFHIANGFKVDAKAARRARRAIRLSKIMGNLVFKDCVHHKEKP